MEKVVVFLDNDGTLSQFRNGDFASTVWEDLLSSFVTTLCEMTGEHSSTVMQSIEEARRGGGAWSKTLSQKYGLDRSVLLTKAWGSLNPSEYIMRRSAPDIWGVVNDLRERLHIILVTGAPRVWCIRSLDHTHIPVTAFDRIITSEEFETKTQLFEKLCRESSYEARHIVAIGDELPDIEYIDSQGGTGILVGKTTTEGLYSSLRNLLPTPCSPSFPPTQTIESPTVTVS